MDWRRALPRLSAAAVAATFLGSFGACKPAASDADAGGVRKSCETRKTWEHAIRRNCSTCISKATTPKCSSCGAKEYSGKCAEQEKAKRDEPTCEGTHECVHKCKRNDCDCVEKCYEGKPKCQALAAAVDACATEACDSYCK